jgi:hypothetical protein
MIHQTLRPTAAHRHVILLEAESCQAQLTFLGNPFVRFARMFDPIFKLTVVALRQSPGDLVCPAGSILAA